MQANKYILTFLLLISYCLISAQNNKINNTLLVKSTLQYQAPRFDLIKDEHFKPAFDEGIKIQNKRIQTITNNKAIASFKNTILALEFSGLELARAQNVFYNLTASNTNPTIQKLEQEYAPIFSSHSDNIYMNSYLYNRIKSVNISTLSGEDKKLTEYYLQQFELAGANLSDSNKTKMKKLNEELATLQT